MAAPTTSITLLSEIAHGADSVRWTEFYRRYEPVLRAYLRGRFPSVEADDVIQETMIALAKRLPDYHYVPDEHGHFRNYLVGILKHKAMDALGRYASQSDIKRRLAENPDGAPAEPEDSEEEAWKTAAMETAVEQLMSDPALPARNREIFRHVALLHEPPAVVADAFGVSRNNVDQIKRRMIDRLRKLVDGLLADQG